jgi:hypothetical protein
MTSDVRSVESEPLTLLALLVLEMQPAWYGFRREINTALSTYTALWRRASRRL